MDANFVHRLRRLLLASRDSELTLDTLPSAWQAAYGIPLLPKRLGYISLKQLLEAAPNAVAFAPSQSYSLGRLKAVLTPAGAEDLVEFVRSSLLDHRHSDQSTPAAHVTYEAVTAALNYYLAGMSFEALGLATPRALIDLLHLDRRVTLAIEAYSAARAVLTLYDLQQHICETEVVPSYTALRLGPLQANPTARRIFFPPPHLPAAAATVRNVIQGDNAAKRRRRDGASVQVASGQGSASGPSERAPIFAPGAAATASGSGGSAVHNRTSQHGASTEQLRGMLPADVPAVSSYDVAVAIRQQVVQRGVEACRSAAAAGVSAPSSATFVISVLRDVAADAGVQIAAPDAQEEPMTAAAALSRQLGVVVRNLLSYVNIAAAAIAHEQQAAIRGAAGAPRRPPPPPPPQAMKAPNLPPPATSQAHSPRSTAVQPHAKSGSGVAQPQHQKGMGATSIAAARKKAQLPLPAATLWESRAQLKNMFIPSGDGSGGDQRHNKAADEASRREFSRRMADALAALRDEEEQVQALWQEQEWEGQEDEEVEAAAKAGRRSSAGRAHVRRLDSDDDEEEEKEEESSSSSDSSESDSESDSRDSDEKRQEDLLDEQEEQEAAAAWAAARGRRPGVMQVVGRMGQLPDGQSLTLQGNARTAIARAFDIPTNFTEAQLQAVLQRMLQQALGGARVQAQPAPGFYDAVVFLIVREFIGPILHAQASDQRAQAASATTHQKGKPAKGTPKAPSNHAVARTLAGLRRKLVASPLFMMLIRTVHSAMRGQMAVHEAQLAAVREWQAQKEMEQLRRQAARQGGKKRGAGAGVDLGSAAGGMTGKVAAVIGALMNLEAALSAARPKAGWTTDALSALRDGLHGGGGAGSTASMGVAAAAGSSGSGGSLQDGARFSAEKLKALSTFVDFLSQRTANRKLPTEQQQQQQQAQPPPQQQRPEAYAAPTPHPKELPAAPHDGCGGGLGGGEVVKANSGHGVVTPVVAVPRGAVIAAFRTAVLELHCGCCISALADLERRVADRLARELQLVPPPRAQPQMTQSQGLPSSSLSDLIGPGNAGQVFRALGLGSSLLSALEALEDSELLAAVAGDAGGPVRAPMYQVLEFIAQVVRSCRLAGADIEFDNDAAADQHRHCVSPLAKAANPGSSTPAAITAAVTRALCTHFDVPRVECLGHGPVGHLLRLASSDQAVPAPLGWHSAVALAPVSNANWTSAASLTFPVSAAEGTTAGAPRIGAAAVVSDVAMMGVGVLGSCNRMAALAALRAVPDLADVRFSTHWDLVFAPELGPLEEFLRQEGATAGVAVLELPMTLPAGGPTLELAAGGRLIKLPYGATPANVVTAVSARNPRGVAAALLSVVAAAGGMGGCPSAVLARHLAEALVDMAQLSGGGRSDAMADLATSTRSRPLPARPNGTDREPGPNLTGRNETSGDNGAATATAQSVYDTVTVEAEEDPGAAAACRFVLLVLPYLPLPLLPPLAETVLLPALAAAMERTPGLVPAAAGATLYGSQRHGAAAGVDVAARAVVGPAVYGGLLRQCMGSMHSGWVPRTCLHRLGFCLGVELWQEDWRRLYGERGGEPPGGGRGGTTGGCADAMVADAAAGGDGGVEEGGAAVMEVDEARTSTHPSASEPAAAPNTSAKRSQQCAGGQDMVVPSAAAERSAPRQSGSVAAGGNESRTLASVTATQQRPGTVGPRALAVKLPDQPILSLSESWRFVESLRREEFGLGLQLGGAAEALSGRLAARMGRALQRLAAELYSTDSHFVMELVQNADDNSYPDGVVPSLEFVLQRSAITAANNELGFGAKHLRALCDVGASTKARVSGYIGQKGIGFKSVFRVSSAPEVHSRNFHIAFNLSRHGSLGYCLPDWCPLAYDSAAAAALTRLGCAAVAAVPRAAAGGGGDDTNCDVDTVAAHAAECADADAAPSMAESPNEPKVPPMPPSAAMTTASFPYGTAIVLPLRHEMGGGGGKSSMGSESPTVAAAAAEGHEVHGERGAVLRRRFSDLCPTLLLFLQRLQRITVRDETAVEMAAAAVGDGPHGSAGEGTAACGGDSGDGSGGGGGGWVRVVEMERRKLAGQSNMVQLVVRSSMERVKGAAPTGSSHTATGGAAAESSVSGGNEGTSMVPQVCPSVPTAMTTTTITAMTWAVVTTCVQPPVPRAGLNVAETCVSLAFSLGTQTTGAAGGGGGGGGGGVGGSPLARLGGRTPQPVFAYLPLRSYGLRFVVQADWVVPSSREALDADSPWNQALRAQLPGLFLRALDVFKQLPPPTALAATGLPATSDAAANAECTTDGGPLDGRPTHGRSETPGSGGDVSQSPTSRAAALFWADQWMRCIPLEGEAQGFFAGLPHSIATLLRAVPCIPVVGGGWAAPGDTAVCASEMASEILSLLGGSGTSSKSGSSQVGATTGGPLRTTRTAVTTGVAAAGGAAADGGDTTAPQQSPHLLSVLGLRLVAPEARMLHESRPLRALLGVRDFGPSQLLEVVRHLARSGALARGEVGLPWLARALIALFSATTATTAAVRGSEALGSVMGSGHVSRGALLRELRSLAILPLQGGGWASIEQLAAQQDEDDDSGDGGGGDGDGDEGLRRHQQQNENMQGDGGRGGSYGVGMGGCGSGPGRRAVGGIGGGGGVLFFPLQLPPTLPSDRRPSKTSKMSASAAADGHLHHSARAHAAAGTDTTPLAAAAAAGAAAAAASLALLRRCGLSPENLGHHLAGAGQGEAETAVSSATGTHAIRGPSSGGGGGGSTEFHRSSSSSRRRPALLFLDDRLLSAAAEVSMERCDRAGGEAEELGGGSYGLGLPGDPEEQAGLKLLGRRRRAVLQRGLEELGVQHLTPADLVLRLALPALNRSAGSAAAAAGYAPKPAPSDSYGVAGSSEMPNSRLLLVRYLAMPLLAGMLGPGLNVGSAQGQGSGSIDAGVAATGAGTQHPYQQQQQQQQGNYLLQELKRLCILVTSAGPRAVSCGRLVRHPAARRSCTEADAAVVTSKSQGSPVTAATATAAAFPAVVPYSVAAAADRRHLTGPDGEGDDGRDGDDASDVLYLSKTLAGAATPADPGDGGGGLASLLELLRSSDSGSGGSSGGKGAGAGSVAHADWRLLDESYVKLFPELTPLWLWLFEQLGVLAFPRPHARHVLLTAEDLPASPWRHLATSSPSTSSPSPSPASGQDKKPQHANVYGSYDGTGAAGGHGHCGLSGPGPWVVHDWSCPGLLRLLRLARRAGEGAEKARGGKRSKKQMVATERSGGGVEPGSSGTAAITACERLCQLLAANWRHYSPAMAARLLQHADPEQPPQLAPHPATAPTATAAPHTSILAVGSAASGPLPEKGATAAPPLGPGATVDYSSLSWTLRSEAWLPATMPSPQPQSALLPPAPSLWSGGDTVGAAWLPTGPGGRSAQASGTSLLGVPSTAAAPVIAGRQLLSPIDTFAPLPRLRQLLAEHVSYVDVPSIITVGRVCDGGGGEGRGGRAGDFLYGAGGADMLRQLGVCMQLTPELVLGLLRGWSSGPMAQGDLGRDAAPRAGGAAVSTVTQHERPATGAPFSTSLTIMSGLYGYLETCLQQHAREADAAAAAAAWATDDVTGAAGAVRHEGGGGGGDTRLLSTVLAAFEQEPLIWLPDGDPMDPGGGGGGGGRYPVPGGGGATTHHMTGRLGVGSDVGGRIMDSGSSVAAVVPGRFYRCCDVVLSDPARVLDDPLLRVVSPTGPASATAVSLGLAVNRPNAAAEAVMMSPLVRLLPPAYLPSTTSYQSLGSGIGGGSGSGIGGGTAGATAGSFFARLGATEATAPPPPPSFPTASATANHNSTTTRNTGSGASAVHHTGFFATAPVRDENAIDLDLSDDDPDSEVADANANAVDNIKKDKDKHVEATTAQWISPAPNTAARIGIRSDVPSFACGAANTPGQPASASAHHQTRRIIAAEPSVNDYLACLRRYAAAAAVAASSGELSSTGVLTTAPWAASTGFASSSAGSVRNSTAPPSGYGFGPTAAAAAAAMRILAHWAERYAAGQLSEECMWTLRSALAAEAFLPCESGLWAPLGPTLMLNDDPWVAEALMTSMPVTSMTTTMAGAAAAGVRPMDSSGWLQMVRLPSESEAGAAAVATLMEALGVQRLSRWVKFSVDTNGSPPPAVGTAVEGAVRQTVLAAERILSAMLLDDGAFAALQAEVSAALPNFRVLVLPTFRSTLSLHIALQQPHHIHPSQAAQPHPPHTLPSRWSATRPPPPPSPSPSLAAAPSVVVPIQPPVLMVGPVLYVRWDAATNFPAISRELSRLFRRGSPWPALAERLLGVLLAAAAGGDVGQLLQHQGVPPLAPPPTPTQHPYPHHPQHYGHQEHHPHGLYASAAPVGMRVWRWCLPPPLAPPPPPIQPPAPPPPPPSRAVAATAPLRKGSGGDGESSDDDDGVRVGGDGAGGDGGGTNKDEATGDVQVPGRTHAVVKATTTREKTPKRVREVASQQAADERELDGAQPAQHGGGKRPKTEAPGRSGPSQGRPVQPSVVAISSSSSSSSDESSNSSSSSSSSSEDEAEEEGPRRVKQKKIETSEMPNEVITISSSDMEECSTSSDNSEGEATDTKQQEQRQQPTRGADGARKPATTTGHVASAGGKSAQPTEPPHQPPQQEPLGGLHDHPSQRHQQHGSAPASWARDNAPGALGGLASRLTAQAAAAAHAVTYQQPTGRTSLERMRAATDRWARSQHRLEQARKRQGSTRDEDAHVSAIGRWGEEMVYRHLLQQLEREQQEQRRLRDAAAAGGGSRALALAAEQQPRAGSVAVDRVVWVNRERETGLPYDMYISHADESVTYIEVKASASATKDLFEISLAELHFAEAQGEHYVLFRVLGAGGSNPSIVRLPDPIRQLRQRTISLCLAV